MRTIFVAQPYEAGFDLTDYLRYVRYQNGVERLDIAVAWAKRSGYRQVSSHLEELRRAGVRIRIVVGIDAGGATRQGLAMTMDLADEAFVFHLRGRTFHSKLYAAYGLGAFSVLTGSHNITQGGAVENFEAGVLVVGDSKVDEDRRFLHTVTDYIDRLIADTGVCRPLTDDLLSRLLSEPRFAIGDEDEPQSGSVTHGARATASSELFGSSNNPLKSAGRIAGVNGRPSGRVAGPGLALRSQTGGATVLRRWDKVLNRSDAQRLGGSAKPSGTVTLVDGRRLGNAAVAGRYFRRDFFGAANWYRSRSGAYEQADVTFEVFIHGTSTGHVPLTVVYNVHHESGQGNRSASLRWNSLNAYLRDQADHVGDTLTLEAREAGAFALFIQDSTVGPFRR